MSAPQQSVGTPDRQAGAREEPLVIGDDMLAPRTAVHGVAGGNGRVDFEQGMSYFPPFTLLLIVALVACYAWQEMTGALRSADAIISAGALSRKRVVAGESWRLVTAGFLHGGPQHLVGNCASLYILGMGCEHAFGFVRTLALYVAALLAGSCMSVLLHPGPSVGASGAIFGLMGALGVVLLRWRDVYHVRDGRIATVVGVWALYILGMGALTPYVDNAAHLGGLAAGGMLALVFQPLAVTRSSRRPVRG